MNSDKPIILVIKDIEEELVKIINDSKLPAFFLRRILYKLYKELEKVENDEIIYAQEHFKNKGEKLTKEVKDNGKWVSGFWRFTK